MTEIEIPCSCVNIPTQTSKCKSLKVETIVTSSLLSPSRAKAQTKLCPIISLRLRFPPNKMWSPTNGKGSLLRDKRCLISLTVRARMSGLHSRLHRVDEKNQANMMRKESESYHSLSLRQKATTIKRPKEKVNFYNIYSLYMYIVCNV